MTKCNVLREGCYCPKGKVLSSPTMDVCVASCKNVSLYRKKNQMLKLSVCHSLPGTSVWTVQGCTGPNGKPMKVSAATFSRPRGESQEALTSLCHSSSSAKPGRAIARNACVTRTPWAWSAGLSSVLTQKHRCAISARHWCTGRIAVKRQCAVSDSVLEWLCIFFLCFLNSSLFFYWKYSLDKCPQFMTMMHFGLIHPTYLKP